VIITQIGGRWEFRPSPAQVRWEIIGSVFATVFSLLCLGGYSFGVLSQNSSVSGTLTRLFFVALAVLSLGGVVYGAENIAKCWQFRSLPRIIEKSGRISYGTMEVCAAGTARTVLVWIREGEEDTEYSVRLGLAEDMSKNLPEPYFGGEQAGEEVRTLAKKFAMALGVEVMEQSSDWDAA